jgi:hypothetical protein
MHRYFWAAVMMAMFVNGASAANERLGNADVIEMVQLELGDELIIGKIQNSPTRFDTSAAALKSLQQSGVSNEVIKAMLSAGSGAVPGAPGLGSHLRKEGAEFSLVGEQGHEVALSAVRVSSEISHRKRWIPVAGAYMNPETFMFVQGKQANLRIPADAEFITRIDPTQIRLVNLGLHKSGKRFVVFSGNSSDRERDFRAENLGDGWHKLSFGADLPSGEYAYIVAAELPSGMGWWAWFAAYGAQAAKAYDFGIN